MKTAFETIAWGIRLTDIRRVLDLIRAAGFDGIEISQRFDMIGVENVQELLALVRERDLVLAGLVGGTPEERVRFCGAPCVDYLYIEPWERDALPMLVNRGFQGALHPRVFTAITHAEDIRKALERQPDLKLIIDTAHVEINGQRALNVIRDFWSQLAAVHLKDWTPDYGRSNYRYAKGFREPGRGIIRLDEVAEELIRRSFDGWVVAEIDRPSSDPETSVMLCADWMRERGLMARPKRVPPVGPPSPPAPSPPDIDAAFWRRLAQATSEEGDQLYHEIAAAFLSLSSVEMVRIWSCSPTQEYAALVASVPSVTNHSGTVRLKLSDMLTSVAMHRRAVVTMFNLTPSSPAVTLSSPDLECQSTDLHPCTPQQVYSLPIYNYGNQNYVRLLVNIATNGRLTYSETEWQTFSRAVAVVADAALERRCGEAAGRITSAATLATSLSDFLSRIVIVVREMAKCQGATLFRLDETNERIVVAATTGITWRDDRHWYERHEGVIGQCWRRGEPLLRVDASGDREAGGRSAEVVDTENANNALMWVPMFGSGQQVIGVFRCRMKSGGSGRSGGMFVEEDAAAVDAVCHAAAAHIERLAANERTARSLIRMSHELKVPVVAVRAVIDTMRTRIGRADMSPAFQSDLLEDAWSWTELMQRLIQNAEAFGAGGVTLGAITQAISLLTDVVAPAVHQVTALLDARGFRIDGISYSLEGLPKLWVDRNAFQQVIFNLLSNTIKYAHSDPGRFYAEIAATVKADDILITIRDFGIGIKEIYRTLVFDEGFRAPEALRQNPSGDGVGLWIVRQIVEAHRGRVWISQFGQPTEISISLPRRLTRKPPPAPRVSETSIPRGGSENQ